MTEITNSWEAVRSAYDRASQMAVQTVEAYAAIGDMLLRLKGETAHGEFTQRCAEAFYEMPITDRHLKQARDRASNYMRLADHRDKWLPHNPQSLNEAMKLLPKKAQQDASTATRKDEPMKKADRAPVGVELTKLAAAAGLNAFDRRGSHEITKRLHDALGVKTLNEIDMNDPKVYEAARACVANAAGQSPEQLEQEFRKEAALLPQKDKRRVEKLEEMLRAMYVADVQRGVQEEYKRQQADLIAEMVAERDGYIKKHLAAATMKASMTAILTEDDYRFLLNVLHPDRAPADRRDKFARAFDIVRKLDPYIQAVKA